MPDPHIQFLISVAALVIAGISLLDKLYGKSANTQKEIAEINKELASLKTKVEPFWNMIEDHLPDMLKQPVHLKMDTLLTLYQTCRSEMTTEQLVELRDELLKAKDEAKAKKDGRAMGYVWMAGVVDSRIAERKKTEAEKAEKVRLNGKLPLS